MEFLHKDFLPDQFVSYKSWKRFNTFNYGIAVTIFSWFEASYTLTLFYMHKNYDVLQPEGYYNQDRRFNIKFRPLNEGKYWPAIAIGVDDVGRFNKINDGNNNNNYFQNIYGVISKNFIVHDHELGVHIGYRYYPSNKNENRTGAFAGLTYRPAFYYPLRFMAEYDGINTSIGADVLLWKQYFIQVGLIHREGFFGDLSYHYKIPF